LDLPARTVRTAAGRELRADAVVIATGLTPRPPAGGAGPRGTHLLRTLDDARALRADLATASRLVVVGDGVLGSEVAATARRLGVDTTLLGPQPYPMAAQLGTDAARLLAESNTRNGVRLLPGDGAAGLIADDHQRVSGVRLVSGPVLPADVVLVAIGAVPSTGWLTDSGLTLDDGVLCDAHCRAGEGVYAAGDVARWHHAALDRPVRLENRANATAQALAVAGTILGAERPYQPVPSFWTDQFDARVQVYGVISPDAEVTVVEGDPAGGRFVAVHRTEGALTAVVGWNMPKQARLRAAELSALYSRPRPASRATL
ncbi:NAD(P)/FAD-dependent oxidoreductase, partial [Streptomyces sp. SM12]|uniref:NAD(P)/FAD-dependent oxidoreductase n=1 Tax=Streptomyces sp. SM12 TaxID=1071602 RepID=UPI000CD4F445